MNVHDIYARVSPWFRRKRFARFREILRPRPTDRILDVGGVHATWVAQPPCAASVELLNILPSPLPKGRFPEYRFRETLGSALDLPYADGSFDIGFSNSVIEHVGTWENQVAFAREIRRVAPRLWVQTPARSFFIEPHYLAPFIHWLPPGLRVRCARWLTPWGWLARPDRAAVEERVREIRLLSRRELQELFPDCRILRETFLGLFTKSYVACRDLCDPPSGHP
jgi:SAM-dependent methyltransferase